MPASYRFRVHGRVQGVYYRQSAANEAARLGLDGWVRNCADGSVEGVAAGDDASLAMFRDWLKRGPPAARVEALDWTADDAPPSASGFSVLR